MNLLCLHQDIRLFTIVICVTNVIYVFGVHNQKYFAKMNWFGLMVDGLIRKHIP
jgi:hypothetical protein